MSCPPVPKAFLTGCLPRCPSWHGPVRSAYGVHLVYVHSRDIAPEPTFAVVQVAVREDWRDQKRREFNEEFYTNLRERYTVIIEDESKTRLGKVTARQEAK